MPRARRLSARHRRRRRRGGGVGGGDYAGDAGAYDPDTDSWREIRPGPLSARVEHSAVWTGTVAGRFRHAATWNGDAMIVWGDQRVGGGGSSSFRGGAIYRPSSE